MGHISYLCMFLGNLTADFLGNAEVFGSVPTGMQSGAGAGAGTAGWLAALRLGRARISGRHGSGKNIWRVRDRDETQIGR